MKRSGVAAYKAKHRERDSHRDHDDFDSGRAALHSVHKSLAYKYARILSAIKGG